jgi:hypothetical protein
MKTVDVKIGETYLTKVGQTLVKVIVSTEAGRRLAYAGEKDGSRRFHCKRVDNGLLLPKPRTAAALRPVPAPAKAFEVRANDASGELLLTGKSAVLSIDDVARVASRNAKVKAHFSYTGELFAFVADDRFELRASVDEDSRIVGYIHVSVRQ